MELFQFVRSNFWLILFFVWGFPLFQYRSRFRKMIYQTDDWTINIQPKFVKEMQGLLGNLFPENEEYISLRDFYRFYLAIYVILFLLWKFS